MSAPQAIKIQGDSFKRAISLSVTAHVALVLLFFINVTFFKKPLLIDLSQAIRVDMVGLPDKIDSKKLPDKIQNIPTAAAAKHEPKPVVEKLPEKVKPTVAKPIDAAIDLKKTKSKQKEALEKLKKSSAIDKIKQEMKNEDLQKKVQEDTAKAIAKGRVISAGTTLTGLDKLDANNYLQEVDQQVKASWALPQWLMNKPYKARVHVKFDANGKIISRLIMLSSGEASYDNYCLQAVDQAAPFPKVPDKFVEKFSLDGVVIGFPE